MHQPAVEDLAASASAARAAKKISKNFVSKFFFTLSQKSRAWGRQFRPAASRLSALSRKAGRAFLRLFGFIRLAEPSLRLFGFIWPAEPSLRSGDWSAYGQLTCGRTCNKINFIGYPDRQIPIPEADRGLRNTRVYNYLITRLGHNNNYVRLFQFLAYLIIKL